MTLPFCSLLFNRGASVTYRNGFNYEFPKGSKEDLYLCAVSALIASTPDQNISQVLSTIKAGTEELSNGKHSIFHLARFGRSLECLLNRLLDDEKNMSLILSILADVCISSDIAHNAVSRHDLLVYVGKILKSHRHDEIIINNCLRLVDNACLHDKEQLAYHVERGESSLNIIESIIWISRSIHEKDVFSKTTLILSLSSLHNILRNMDSPEMIVRDYRIVQVLGCMMVKYIDDWKTSEKNHDTLASVLKVLECCSTVDCNTILHELKNTGIGDAVLLLSDLIIMSTFSLTVTNIVSNLQSRYWDASFSDIYGKLIEKLRDSNGTKDQQYTFFLQSLCQLSNAKTLTENVMVTVTISLLNVLQSHVEPTEASLEHCQMVIATLRQDHFKCCLRLMLDSGILTIISRKLDWIFGVKLQLDMFHPSELSMYLKRQPNESDDEDYSYQLRINHHMIFDCQFYNDLNTWYTGFTAINYLRPCDCICSLVSATSALTTSDHETNDELNLEEEKISGVKNEQKRAESEKSVDISRLYCKLAAEIVNFIECFVNLKPTPPELGTSDIVYKLLHCVLPKYYLFMLEHFKEIIMNIIKKPELSINLLMQTHLVRTVNGLCSPKNIHKCMRCRELYFLGRNIVMNLTQVVDGTSDFAHNFYTASPTVKQKVAMALPFFSKTKSTLNNLMLTCGGLDALMDGFRRENPQRGIVIDSLKVLLIKLLMKDPTDCTNNFDFDDNNDEVAIVLNLKNYQPGAGHLVTFKLDDDSCLQADCKLLASKSDFFNQLLFGQFKEAHLEVVRLPETPHDSFKLVLMLLQLGYIVSGDKLCLIGAKLFKRVDLPVVLETIVLCDRFLLKDLCMSLALFVQHREFSATTVPIIYRWLVDSPTHILRMEIVEYYLIGYMREEQRDSVFEELLQSEYSEQFVDDMKNMFKKYLCAS